MESVIARIFGAVGSLGFAVMFIKYAYTHKDKPIHRLAYLAALASLTPLIKVVVDLMEGASHLLIVITVVLIFIAFLTISQRIWEIKSSSLRGRTPP